MLVSRETSKYLGNNVTKKDRYWGNLFQPSAKFFLQKSNNDSSSLHEWKNLTTTAQDWSNKHDSYFLTTQIQLLGPFQSNSNVFELCN